jgi:hypothetical protein
MNDGDSNMQEKEIVIRIRFPKWPKRWWLLAIGGGLCVLGAGAYAYTFNPFSLTNPVAGTPVSAATITANYTAITNKVTELQNVLQKPYFTNPNGQTYSIAAGYCGLTAVTKGAVADGTTLTGIAATKSLCQKACSGSATAHMCTTAEVQRWIATGGSIPVSSGWYTSGLWSWDGLSGQLITDCNSWTTSAHTIEGPVSYPKDPAHSDYCDRDNPMICCD